jgi:hypothetical protein
MKTQLEGKAVAVFLAIFLCVAPAFPKDTIDVVPRGNWGVVGFLEEGASLSVSMNSGDKMEGKFLGLEPDAIRLKVDKKERIYPRASITEIRQLHIPDSKLNGTLIGMGAGMVAGIITASASGALKTGDTAGRQWGSAFIMAGMGFGALFGCIADATIKGSKLIYLK